MTTSVRTETVGAARAAAAAGVAARRAGVQIRPLNDPAGTRKAAALFQAIWGSAPGSTPVNSDLMRALASTGNYVAGAFTGDEMVGAAVGFFTEGQPPALHSHICGVRSGEQGRSVGFAIKQHQRAWAMKRGLAVIGWTVDPLVRRNVYFNLVKLGAEVSGYLTDYYGPMSDGMNGPDASDRLHLSWRLADHEVADAADGTPRLLPADVGTPALLTVGAGGEPVAGELTGDRVVCEVPDHILTLRRVEPDLARRWRSAVRTALDGALRQGWRIVGMDHGRRYVLING